MELFGVRIEKHFSQTPRSEMLRKLKYIEGTQGRIGRIFLDLCEYVNL